MGIPVVAGYEDVEAVAAGGHGTVFRARQTRLDRTVALKAVTIDATDDGARASMLRESRIMAAVSQHPNIVTIHDTVFAADGSLCLVMDWYQRGSLADEIAANGPLPVERVLDHGIKLAAALHAAHDRGIVHRDLKPGNILLSDYGEPAITDFGTASYRSDRTDPDGLRAVTLHYAAPELLDDGPVTPAADVYALAATLYHAVSGRRPFASGAAPSLEELVGRVVAGEPAALGDDTPAPLRTVIVADLAKDPARRHPTARALAEALQGVQSELGIAATPIVSPSAVAALAGLANDDPTDGSDVPFTAASAEGAGARTGVPPGRRPSWPQRQMSWATERYGPWPAIGVTLLVVLAVAAILPWRPTGRGPFLASERQATTDAPADIAVGEPGPDDVDLAAVFDRPLSDDEPDGADDALDSASQIGGTESPAGSGSEATGPSTADAASGAASLEPAGDNGPSSTSPPPTPTTERPTTITDAAPGTEPTSPAPSTSSVVGVDCSVWYTPARGEQVSPYAAVTSVDAAVRRAPDGAAACERGVVLPAGAEVMVHAERGGWVYTFDALTNDWGWIPGSAFTSPSTSSVVGVDCSVWYTPARGEQVSPYAAVTSVDAAVRRAPDGAAACERGVVLPAGAEVMVHAERGGWVYTFDALTNDWGWIPAAAVAGT